MDLSIIIVNWNSGAFLEKCLASICANTKGIEFEVIVIDNASFDGSREIVEKGYAQIRFLQSSENLGFAGANNVAFQQSRGRNVLFLNPDTEIVGPALPTMVSLLDANPDAGIVGCKLLNSDGSVQTSCIQAFPTILNQMLDAELLRRLFPRSRLWGMRALWEESSTPAEVEMISGACLLIRRRVFEEVGCFTTDYFMYTEDLDLCFKVKSAGQKNYYVGNATVIHHGGQSSSANSESHFANIVMRESISKFLRMRRGTAYAVAYKIAMSLAAGCRIIALGVIFVVTLGLFRRISLQRRFAKWVKVLRWAVGLEGWTGRLGVKTA